MIERLLWFAAILAILLVPIAILIFRSMRNRWTIAALLFFTLNAVGAAWYLAPWFAWSFWLRRLILVLVLLATAIGLYKFVKAKWRKPTKYPLLASVLIVFAGSYFGLQNLRAIDASKTSLEAIELSSPIKDVNYIVMQGGAGPPLQMGHNGPPSQRFAVDLIKVNEFLIGHRTYLQLDDYTQSETWELPIYSPCEGVVVWARDGLEDSDELDLEKPAGNVVGIDCLGATVMLAHFRKNTVAVMEGDIVQTGQLLGKIGMSGRTFGPHLHIHAERGPLKKDFSDNPSVPMHIDGRFLILGQLIESSDE